MTGAVRPAAPRAASWTETVLVATGASAVMLALTWPAFATWFFAENFVYLGQYHAAGDDFWRAAFSPTHWIFFRPVLFAANLPWHFVLPLDPFWFHCRNFAFAALDVLLFHRVLLRFAASWQARVVAVLLVAVSKIHLTTIGYVNLFDVVVLLGLILLTVLFLLRWLDGGRAGDYAAMLVCCLLTIFSKDYGFAVVPVLVAIVAARPDRVAGPRPLRFWTWRLIVPVTAMIVSNLALRAAIVQGPSVAKTPLYVPTFSPALVGQKLLLFTSTIGNLSFLHDGTDGASGLSARVASALAVPSAVAIGETAQLLALVALVALTFWRGRRAGRTLLIPAVWIAAYLAPTTLTPNLQIYYYQEPLVGLALGIAICWPHLGAPIRRLWGAALVVIALNGALANPALELHWAYCARHAALIRGPLVEWRRGGPVGALTFVTTRRDFWHFTLVGERPAMLRELLASPDLRVDVIPPEDVAARREATGAAHLFLDADAGFARLP